MSERIEEIIDLSDAEKNRELRNIIAARRGVWRFELCRYRRRRTDRQNRFYWPCFCKLFSDWLSETQGERVHPDVAHEIFKATFLRVPVCDSNGEQLSDPQGDPLTRTRSTTELSVDEFNLYLDQCAGLLRDLCDIDVPQPNAYREVLDTQNAG